MHGFSLRDAQRPTDEPRDPGPQIDVFALDFLRMLFAYLMLLGVEMSLVGSPAIGGKPGDATRGQELLPLQEDRVLPPSKHIGQALPRVVVYRMPHPAWVGFTAHVTPPLVQL